VIGAKSGNNFDPLGKMTQGEFLDALILAHGWGFLDLIEGNFPREIQYKEKFGKGRILQGRDRRSRTIQ
jgi:hypothetical protein